MILLSLVLVLLSLGLLAAGLADASQPLVWASILASLVAGGVLTLAALRRRGLPRGDAEDDERGDGGLAGLLSAPDVGEDVPAGSGWADRTGAGLPAAASGPPAGALDDPTDAIPVVTEAIPGVTEAVPVVTEAVPVVTEAVPAVQDDGDRTAAAEPDDTEDSYPDPPDEPPEEEVAAPDALQVAKLEADVSVVDGRPRYHLADCRHLRGREVVALPVAEARETGFTPCSLCRPDATLLRLARQAPGDAPGDAQVKASPDAEREAAGSASAAESSAAESPAEDASRRR